MKFPSSLDKRKFLTNISFLMWSIWKARCQFIFDGCKLEPIRVLQMANSANRDFLEACLPLNSIGITKREVLPTQSHWTPHRLGWTKVNSDGAWKSNKATGLRVIIRNSEGAFCEGLAEVVKSGISGNYGNRAWSILPILLEIRRTEGLFDSVKWCWILRYKNRAAHMAASIGIGVVHRETWLNQPPLSLVHVLSSDGLPCPLVM
ncbi:unnamed protein product [Prunus armeniaca]|uniref:RNase H type-1 domain-containing protein n=1 Tax=Prunus armeniaca TaxID=36596 RepID=A0A6J5XI17_PRUAR|nr:unnamed protein product [Prunus armeniaca]